MSSAWKNNGAPEGVSVIFFINIFRMRYIIWWVLLLILLLLNPSSLYPQTGNDIKEINVKTPVASGTNFDGRMLAGLNGDSIF